MKSLQEYSEKMESLREDSILYNSDYNFGGFVVQVQANDYRVISTLDEYFEKFRHEFPVQIHAIVKAYHDQAEKIEMILKLQEPETEKTKMEEMYFSEKDSLLIHKISTGINFLYKDVERIAHGPILKHMDELINFINQIKLDDLLQKTGGQILKAAGISKNFVGMALSGPSDQDISRLCLKMLGDGIGFLGSECLVLENQDGYLMMNGTPKYPKVSLEVILSQPNLHSVLSQNELDYFSPMSREEILKRKKSYDVRTDQHIQGSDFNFDAELKYLIVFNWETDSEEETSLKEIEIKNRKDILSKVIKRPGLMVPKSKSRLDSVSDEVYIDLLSKCKVFELRGKVDFDAAKNELSQIF